MPIIGQDTFAAPSDVTLASHTPTGATPISGWVKHAWLSGTGTVRTATEDLESAGGVDSLYYASDTPGSADEYSQFSWSTTSASDAKGHGPAVRIAATGTNTLYWLRTKPSTSRIELYQTVAGTTTLLDHVAFSPSTSTPYIIRLEVQTNGSGNVELKCLIDSVEQSWVGAGGVTYTDSSGSKITATGHCGILLQASTNGRVDDFECGTLTVPDVVSVSDEPADLRVFQRDASGVYSLSLSGTYGGANTPTAIEYRLVEHGTTTPITGHDWQTLDAAPSGSAWSGTISDIPAGNVWMNVDVRWSNDTGVTDEGSNRFAVGAVVWVLGQSQGRNLFQTGTSYTQTQTGSQYTGNTTIGESVDVWAAAASSGVRQLIDDLAGTLGVAVGAVKSAIGSTALTSAGDTGSGYWLDESGGEPWALAQADLTAATGGECEAILWLQGEQDAFQGLVSLAVYKAGLTSFKALVDAYVTPGYTHSAVPFIVLQTGRDANASRSDAGYTAIREAQRQWCAETSGAYLGGVAIDLPLQGDNIHYTEAGLQTAATRLAHAYRAILGLSGVWPSPVIARFEIVDATHTDIFITHGDGTDFTPTSAITGFRVNDGALAVSAAAQQSTTSIRLTHASGTVTTVDYMYGAAPTITGVVVDDTALTLPLVPREDIDANAAPVFDGPDISIDDITANRDMPNVDVSGRFSDADADALTFDKTGTWPAGVTVSSSGVIGGRPTTAGTYTGLAVTASDGSASATSNTFSITVLEAATGGGIGKRGRQRRVPVAGYPRRILIDGNLYVVQTPSEERELLAAFVQREEVDAPEDESPPAQAKRKRRVLKIAKTRLERVDSKEKRYFRVLSDEDEQIITLYALRRFH